MQSPEPAYVVRQPQAAQRWDVIRWLSGQTGIEAPAADGREPWEGTELVEARRGERLVGAAMARELAPGIVDVTAPRLTSEEGIGTAASLLEQLHCLERLRGSRLWLLHIPGDLQPLAPRLLALGYRQSSDLLIMGCPVADRLSKRIDELTLDPCKDATERLAKVVDSTYIGTRDYPEMNGHLHALDALAIYRASAGTCPRFWYILSDSRREVGCLLLTHRDEAKLCEISYMGVLPSARGEGHGGRILGVAVGIAEQCGAERILLGVDSKNDVAIHLYRKADFECLERRVFFWRDAG